MSGRMRATVSFTVAGGLLAFFTTTALREPVCPPAGPQLLIGTEAAPGSSGSASISALVDDCNQFPSPAATG